MLNMGIMLHKKVNCLDTEVSLVMYSTNLSLHLVLGQMHLFEDLRSLLHH